MEGLKEEEIRSMVIDILNGSIKEDTDNLEELLKVISDGKNKRDSKFILRGSTGRKAVEFFMQFYKEHEKPVRGHLIDTRDEGCGYNFKIVNSESVYVEVKGLSEEPGGVLFTNKEWKAAKKAQDNYYLALVSKISTTPEISFIKNPASILKPKRI